MISGLEKSWIASADNRVGKSIAGMPKRDTVSVIELNAILRETFNLSDLFAVLRGASIFRVS